MPLCVSFQSSVAVGSSGSGGTNGSCRSNDAMCAIFCSSRSSSVVQVFSGSTVRLKISDSSLMSLNSSVPLTESSVFSSSSFILGTGLWGQQDASLYEAQNLVSSLPANVGVGTSGGRAPCCFFPSSSEEDERSLLLELDKDDDSSSLLYLSIPTNAMTSVL